MRTRQPPSPIIVSDPLQAVHQTAVSHAIVSGVIHSRNRQLQDVRLPTGQSPTRHGGHGSSRRRKFARCNQARVAENPAISSTWIRWTSSISCLPYTIASASRFQRRTIRASPRSMVPWPIGGPTTAHADSRQVERVDPPRIRRQDERAVGVIPASSELSTCSRHEDWCRSPPSVLGKRPQHLSGPVPAKHDLRVTATQDVLVA